MLAESLSERWKLHSIIDNEVSMHLCSILWWRQLYYYYSLVKIFDCLDHCSTIKGV